VNPDLRTALIFIYSLPFSRGVNMTEGGLLSIAAHCSQTAFDRPHLGIEQPRCHADHWTTAITPRRRSI